MTPYTAFLGDAEYQFKLTPAGVKELESKCNAGIGVICSRVFAKHFTQADIVETVRLALISGGMLPKRAAEMIALYVADRPLAETYPIAAKVLERIWLGAPHEGEVSAS